MLDLAAMRRAVRKYTGTDDDDLDLLTTDIDLYLNRQYWELQEKFDFREEEVTETFTTVAGIKEYSDPTDTDALKSLAIEDLTLSQHTPLRPMTPDVYYTEFRDVESEYGMPEYYVRSGKGIILWPTPDDAYTITRRRRQTLDDLVLVGDSPELPRAWHEIIEFGGAYRALQHLGDLNRANYYHELVADFIRSSSTQETKEKADLHLAGLRYIGRTY